MNTELLYQKLQRLKILTILWEDIDPAKAEILKRSHQLLSDPSNNLDIVPRESQNEIATTLILRLGKTTGVNRQICETLLKEEIREDKELIKHKLKNMQPKNSEDLVKIASCLRVLRKILSGMSTDLRLEQNE